MLSPSDWIGLPSKHEQDRLDAPKETQRLPSSRKEKTHCNTAAVCALLARGMLRGANSIFMPLPHDGREGAGKPTLRLPPSSAARVLVAPLTGPTARAEPLPRAEKSRPQDNGGVSRRVAAARRSQLYATAPARGHAEGVTGRGPYKEERARAGREARAARGEGSPLDFGAWRGLRLESRWTETPPLALARSN